MMMILFAAALLAADADKPKAAPAGAVAAKPVDPDRQMVCKMVGRTDTRMPARRYCLPAFQWQVMNNNVRRDIGDMQSRAQMEQPQTF